MIPATATTIDWPKGAVSRKRSSSSLQRRPVGSQHAPIPIADHFECGWKSGVCFAQSGSSVNRALIGAALSWKSMGKTGVCWDALAESFFATYKLELIEPATWPTRARARTATVHWLEAVYNRQRRHSAIDMQSPVDYEERYWDRRTAA